MVVVGVGTAVAAVKTLIALNKQVAANKTAADAAKDSADATAAMLATNREIERAYISFVHERIHLRGTPDGQGGFDTKKPKGLTVEIHIRNTGRTPGTFLGGYIGYCLSATPSIPDLKRGTRLFTQSFLHPTEFVDFRIPVNVADDPKAEAALKGDGSLFIVGVADYVDRFGGMHQAGYGRKLSITGTSAHLQYSPETGDWNYDRPMHPDNVRNYQAQKSQSQETRP